MGELLRRSFITRHIRSLARVPLETRDRALRFYDITPRLLQPPVISGMHLELIRDPFRAVQYPQQDNSLSLLEWNILPTQNECSIYES